MVQGQFHRVLVGVETFLNGEGKYEVVVLHRNAATGWLLVLPVYGQGKEGRHRPASCEMRCCASYVQEIKGKHRKKSRIKSNRINRAFL